MRGLRAGLVGLVAGLLTACSGGGGGSLSGEADSAESGAGSIRCIEASRAQALPPLLRESSAAAVAADDRSIWSLNDSGHPAELIRVSWEPDGELVGTRVRVAGARNVDWEALTAGPCPEGRCLFIADTGDNGLDRPDPALYRVPEPGVGDTVTAPAVRIPLELPRGPRDIEALYLLGADLYLVTKGRGGAVELYRVAGGAAAGAAATGPAPVEWVQELAGRPWPWNWVTGAGATPDGAWVVIRTYSALEWYRPGVDGRLERDGRVNLRPLREPQGEGVAVAGDGRVVLTTEAGPGLGRGGVQWLRCEGL